MAKRKYIIFILGALIILSVFTKLFLIEGKLNASYYIVEFIFLLIVIGLVYWLDKIIRGINKQLKSSLKEIDRIKNEFVKRESDLLIKIMNIEEKEKEELQFTVDREKTVAKIINVIDFSKPIDQVTRSLLSSLAKRFEIVVGICYWLDNKDSEYKPISSYALEDLSDIKPFKPEEGFCGQAVKDKEIFVANDIPEEYFSSSSGLGDHVPKNLYFIPILKNNEVIGVIELGTFKSIEIKRIWVDINNNLIDLLKLS